MRELESWQEEKRSGYLYRAVAEAEKGTTRSALFSELALEAENLPGDGPVFCARFDGEV